MWASHAAFASRRETRCCGGDDEARVVGGIGGVRAIGFDDRGKVKLSMKRVDQETGADLEAD